MVFKLYLSLSHEVLCISGLLEVLPSTIGLATFSSPLPRVPCGKIFSKTVSIYQFSAQR
jgi:hypothetical protein